MCGKPTGSHRSFFSVFLSLLLTVPFLTGCEEGASFRVVEVRVGGNEGEDDGVLSLDLWGVIFGPAEEGGVTQLPLRPGDELGVDFDGDGSWIPILPSDGDTLVFRTEDHGVYLGPCN